MNDPSVIEGHTPSLETIDKMLRLATLGHQLLDPQADYTERRWHSEETANVERAVIRQPEGDTEPSNRPVSVNGIS